MKFCNSYSNPTPSITLNHRVYVLSMTLAHWSPTHTPYRTHCRVFNSSLSISCLACSESKSRKCVATETEVKS